MKAKGALEAKNSHIAKLERLVKKQQGAMAPLPVRVAMRLTQRRQLVSCRPSAISCACGALEMLTADGL